MTYAVYKLSWNRVQGQKAQGGIWGTAFFIDQQTALTAYHVAKAAKFGTPDSGFSHCNYWLLGRDGSIVDCKGATLIDHPGIDTTVIKFGATMPNAIALSLSAETISPGLAVSNQGYAEGHGNAQLKWVEANVAVEAFDLSPSFNDGGGTVADCLILNVAQLDVTLTGIKVLRLAYGGQKGMSGGPLVVNGTARVVGLMSFGLPPEVVQKHTLFAVSAEEIIKKL